MKSYEFKLGDTVRCINLNGFAFSTKEVKLILNNVYTISNIKDENHISLYGKGTYGFYKDRFELVKKSKLPKWF